MAAKPIPVGYITDVAEALGMTTYEQLEELNLDYINAIGQAAYDAAIKEGADDVEADEDRLEAEEKEQNVLFLKYEGAVEEVARRLLRAHELDLTVLPRNKRGIRPLVSWDAATMKLMQTINGIGFYTYNLEEFLDSGPYTARQAVESHWKVLRHAYKVYGDISPARGFERAFR